MSALARLAQAKMERAAAQGQFDQFEGKGEPIDPSVWADPHEGEWAMAHRLLREAEMAPRWIELDVEIRRRRQELMDWVEQSGAVPGQPGWARVGRRVTVEIEAINELIESRNFLAPNAVAPRFKLRPERVLEG